MNYLLTIVQGANAGAEIALAEGTVTFGSADSCDIVLADSSLAAEAFAIETTDTGVSLKELPDGEAKKIDLYTLFSFGNSSFAVGENGAAWPELKSPEPPPPPEQPAADTGTDGSDTAPSPPSDTPSPSTDEGARPATEELRQTEAEGKRSSRRSCLGCLLVLVLLLVFFAVGYFLALRYGRIWESVPFVRDKLGTPAVENDSPVVESVSPAEALAAWVATNGLAMVEKDGETVIFGNFAKRADRLTFAQDAYERDANLILDLSDDETLKAGVEEVLFVITEGRTKLEAATNRVVKRAGRARSRDELLQTVATICTDVNRVRVVDDTAVVCDDGKRTDAPTRYQALSSQAARKHPFITPAPRPGMPEPKCPVAGVILMPYPCLVLRDGSRAAEGSMVGEFKVEKIEADKVTLKRGEETVTWKP